MGRSLAPGRGMRCKDEVEGGPEARAASGVLSIVRLRVLLLLGSPGKCPFLFVENGSVTRQGSHTGGPLSPAWPGIQNPIHVKIPGNT